MQYDLHVHRWAIHRRVDSHGLNVASHFRRHDIYNQLMAAHATVFQSLDRMCLLLKSLKYIAIIAMVFVGSQADCRERHVRRHHSDSVERSVRVYVPAVVERNEVSSPFEAGGDYIVYPYANISLLLGWTPEVVRFNDPGPARIRLPDIPAEPDHRVIYGKMLIAGGVVTILAAFAHLMTGRPELQMPAYIAYFKSRPIVTLVETRSWLPTWVSECWLHVKHKLRLR